MKAPSNVYSAARRAYILSSTDLYADDEVSREWAKTRWPTKPIDDIQPTEVAFWIMSIAIQDGYE